MPVHFEIKVFPLKRPLLLGTQVTGQCATTPGGPQTSTKFTSDSPGLISGIILFCIFSFATVVIMVYNRRRGGELGGPQLTRWVSGSMLVAMLLIYMVIMASQLPGVAELGWALRTIPLPPSPGLPCRAQTLSTSTSLLHPQTANDLQACCLVGSQSPTSLVTHGHRGG